MRNSRYFVNAIVISLLIIFAATAAPAQEAGTILTGPELARVIPPGFYFQGLSAPTQLRNSAAVRFGSNRYVLAGLVDTSGYAADVRAKYEGFLITDSQININGTNISTGAYGFGFTDNGKLNILDLAGNELHSLTTTRDAGLRRPRPLMLMKSGNKVRLYSGRDYVEIGTR